VKTTRRKMKKNAISQIFVGALMGATAFSVQANAYEDGLMAYAVGNYTEAGQLLMEAADADQEGAEHMLMRLFAEGKLYSSNVASDTLKWTRRAAEKGIMQAQFALAEIYFQKRGDASAALPWYQRAAEQGHAEAYYRLGGIYETGAKGVSADSSQSKHLFQIAASEFDVYAQKGDDHAQYNLASMYKQGQGVKKNIVLALKWWEKSALQGNVLSQLSLGRVYAQGDGVERNAYLAMRWLQLAAAQGEGEAVAMLRDLEGNARVALAM